MLSSIDGKFTPLSGRVADRPDSNPVTKVSIDGALWNHLLTVEESDPNELALVRTSSSVMSATGSTQMFTVKVMASLGMGVIYIKSFFR